MWLFSSKVGRIDFRHSCIQPPVMQSRFSLPRVSDCVSMWGWVGYYLTLDSPPTSLTSPCRRDNFPMEFNQWPHSTEAVSAHRDGRPSVNAQASPTCSVLSTKPNRSALLKKRGTLWLKEGEMVIGRDLNIIIKMPIALPNWTTTDQFWKARVKTQWAHVGNGKCTGWLLSMQSPNNGKKLSAGTWGGKWKKVSVANHRASDRNVREITGLSGRLKQKNSVMWKVEKCKDVCVLYFLYELYPAVSKKKKNKLK